MLKRSLIKQRADNHKILHLLSKFKLSGKNWSSFEQLAKIDNDMREYDKIDLMKDIDQWGNIKKNKFSGVDFQLTEIQHEMETKAK